jgi:hypothetical protein
MPSVEATIAFACAVCDSERPGFRWTDTHGVAVCGTCGCPYRLYHYENEQPVEKPPSLAVDVEWLPLAREYWRETQRRVFPASHDMGMLRSRGGRSYSGATDEDVEAFNEWMNARKRLWPAVESPEAADAVAGQVD